MRAIFLFAIVHLLVFSTDANPQLGLDGVLNPCGPNQSFRLCGPVCPALCANLMPICNFTICIPGCFCNPGYVRLVRNGQCVGICPLGGLG